MRYQIETIRTVVGKADDLAESQKAALNERDRALEFAARDGWELASTVVLDGDRYATFVDTLTQTPTE